MKKRRNDHLLSETPRFVGRLFKSRYFVRSFCLIIGIMTFFFLMVTLAIYRQSDAIMEKEFITAGQYRLEVTAQAVDNYLMDIRYIAATLDTSQMVQAFFAFSRPDLIYDDFYGRLQENLKAYVNGYSSIDSIYLYSECADSILTATERSRTAHFSDTGWTDYFEEEPEGFRIFFRAKNNAYPFLLCVMKQLKINGKNAAIVININLGRLSHFTEISETPYQEIFLLSDLGSILYRNRQRELTEPLEAVPELEPFLPEADIHSALVAGPNPYTYVQIHSESYPWSYVSVTHLQEYTARLSNSRAVLTTLFLTFFAASVLFAFLVSLRSVKPVQNLLMLLENPREALSRELYGDSQISYIADQITSHIQQNQALSDELSSRLHALNETRLLALQSQINPHFLFNTLNMIHILESEALGYSHPLPRITLNLSKLLRYAIESTDLVTLETELKYTKLYLSILQQRYGGKLQVIYETDENALCARVPKLFIQPIIENAVFHGLAENMNENSALTLICRREEDLCAVTVKDNGVGMPPETLETLRGMFTDSPAALKGNIGFRNVITRMKLLYGDAFRIDIQSRQGEGSAFTLRFPLSRP